MTEAEVRAEWDPRAPTVPADRLGPITDAVHALEPASGWTALMVGVR